MESASLQDETMPMVFIEPVRTHHGPSRRPLTESLPSATGWNQPIVPRNLCLRRSDSILQVGDQYCHGLIGNYMRVYVCQSSCACTMITYRV